MTNSFISEYLTLLANPTPQWWAELEAAAEARTVAVQRTPAESAGQPCWRITLQGEPQAVEDLRNWLLKWCWGQGLNLFMV